MVGLTSENIHSPFVLHGMSCGEADIGDGAPSGASGTGTRHPSPHALGCLDHVFLQKP